MGGCGARGRGHPNGTPRARPAPPRRAGGRRAARRLAPAPGGGTGHRRRGAPRGCPALPRARARLGRVPAAPRPSHAQGLGRGSLRRPGGAGPLGARPGRLVRRDPAALPDGRVGSGGCQPLPALDTPRVERAARRPGATPGAGRGARGEGAAGLGRAAAVPGRGPAVGARRPPGAAPRAAQRARSHGAFAARCSLRPPARAGGLRRRTSRARRLRALLRRGGAPGPPVA